MFGYSMITKQSSYTPQILDYGNVLTDPIPKFEERLLSHLDLKKAHNETYLCLLHGQYSYIMMPRMKTTLLSLPLRANHNRGHGRRELTV